MSVTVSTSVVPGFQRALKRVLENRPGLRAVYVSIGAPYPADIPEWIWIGNVPEHEFRFAGQRPGPHSREEEFVQEVQVSVLMANEKDHEPVDARAYEIAAEIEDALGDDLTVDGSVRNGWVRVEGMTLEKRGPDGEALLRESVLNVRLRGRARLPGGTT